MDQISPLRGKQIVYMPEGVYAKLVHENKRIEDLPMGGQHRNAIAAVTRHLSSFCVYTFTGELIMEEYPSMSINQDDLKIMTEASIEEVKGKQDPFEFKVIYDMNILDGLIVIAPLNVLGITYYSKTTLKIKSEENLRLVISEGMDKYFGKEAVKQHLSTILKNLA